MPIVILVLSVILTSNCFAEAPKWLNNPEDYCSTFELCAVGESSGKMMSEVSARDEIAKIFETKIKSENEVLTTAYSNTDKDGILTGEINEDVRSKINETTELTLKGVVIKEHHEGDESFFSLAVLHKRKAAGFMANEINELNVKNSELFKDARRSSLNKVIKNLAVIETLNSRHEFLIGSKINTSISLAKVMERKRAKRNENLKVLLNIKETEKSKELTHLIKQKLVDNDYIVINDKNKTKFSFKVVGELSSEKQYFNVKGFVKFKYILKITAKNIKGQSVGALEYVSLQTGRSQKQAYANAMPGIRRFISENLDELSMD
jgi:hypothetical protein